LDLIQALLSAWSQPIVVGAWFGLMHALDADHLATIGGLAANNRSVAASGYAARWAAGHAAALGLIALAALGFGLSRVTVISGYAEILVGVALLAIGCHAVRAVWRRRLGIAHAGAPWRLSTAKTGYGEPDARVSHPHLHFFAHSHSHSKTGSTGLLMGLLHGGAGSAAVLALLPLAHLRSGVESAVYLACFSLGVAAGALCFAQLFAKFSTRTIAAGEKLGAAFQAGVGFLAIATGTWLLLGLLLVGDLHGGG
jgi:cytochrome c biogenesis protein CcdA